MRVVRTGEPSTTTLVKVLDSCPRESSHELLARRRLTKLPKLGQIGCADRLSRIHNICEGRSSVSLRSKKASNGNLGLFLGQKLEERPKAVLIRKEVLDCVLISRDERRSHESVLLVLDQFAETDHQTPRIRSQRLQSFKHNRADLLLDVVSFGVGEELEQNEAEEVGV